MRPPAQGYCEPFLVPWLLVSRRGAAIGPFPVMHGNRGGPGCTGKQQATGNLHQVVCIELARLHVMRPALPACTHMMNTRYSAWGIWSINCEHHYGYLRASAPGWHAGTATGTLHQVDRIQPGALEGAAPDEDVVLLVKEASGDEEVGATGLRLRGVILAHSLPHLSHLGESGCTALASRSPWGPPDALCCPT